MKSAGRDAQPVCARLTVRGCDLFALRVCDVAQGGRVAARAIVMQRKTRRPVQFELTEQTRQAVQAWVIEAKLSSDEFLFPSRLRASPHLSKPLLKSLSKSSKV